MKKQNQRQAGVKKANQGQKGGREMKKQKEPEIRKTWQEKLRQKEEAKKKRMEACDRN